MKNLIINKMMHTASLIAFGLFCSLAILGQSNTGTITGVVSDQNGAVLPNASVTATNVGTNERKSAVTDANGLYRIAALSNGVYRISASSSGFSESTISDIRLAVGDTLRVDVVLEVGGVGATVTVANQTTIDTETSTIGDTITAERITNNPVNGRDFTGLLATVPGSVQTTNQFQTSINGIPSTFGGTSVLVDGIDAGRVDLNGTSNVLGRVESRVNRVSMDSIAEVQVLEQSYSAQYGQALGAVINPITKSGTNRFHGSVFNFFRNEALDSEDYFAGKQKFRLNQFGGNLSGPLVKDKLFFFTNYEGVRQTRGLFFNSLTYNQNFRDTMDPALAPAINELPLPQRPFIRPDGTEDPYVGIYQISRDGTLREDTGSVKIDWMQTEKSQFSFRYNINDSKTVTPYNIGNVHTADGTLLVQLFKASHNYFFSNNLINEFAFGINWNDTNPGAGRSTLPLFNLAFVDQALAVPGPAQFNQFRTGVVYHFMDSMSYVRGNHSLKFGVDVRLNRRKARSEVQESMLFFGVDDLRTNTPWSVSRQGHPELHFENENFSFFVQDDWKVIPRLSLNLGLRYDVSTVSREKNGFLQNFDLNTLSYTAPGQKLHDPDTNNFGPRVGFAFDVFGNQKTVLRGGYGIFYNRELPASFGSPHANSFPTQSADLFQALFFCANPPATWGFPIDPAAYECGVNNAYHIEKKINTPMAQQWSLNIQQDLGFGVLQVGYVGNHVTHILTDGVITPRNINRADPVSALRPLSDDWGDIYVVGGYPQSNYNGLQINFKRNLSSGFRYNANYTWSHAIDDVVGFFKDHQDPNNMRAERASSDQDIRHNFSMDAGYELAFRKWFGDGPRWLIDGWQVDTITQFRSGLPVTVTRQGGDFGGFSFRPNAVPGVDPYCSNYSVPNCQFNPDAFDDPGAGIFGNVGRNTLRGPGFAQVDVSFSKRTRTSENTALMLRLDVFNLFNRTNFADPSGGLVQGDNNSIVAPPRFGQSISTVGNQLGGLLGFGGPRQMQISARFSF